VGGEIIPRAKIIQNEWTKDEIDEVLDYYKPITIPVSITIKGRQKVLGFSEVEKILRRAKLISLEPCWCRLKLKNCDGPVDVCICVDKEAELAISERDGWKATLEEAMAALKKTHKAGLVHLAYEFEGHEMRSICSCCACCCHTLAAITRFGYGDIVGRADVVAAHNPSKCNDCKLCVSKCHFYAWDLVGEKVHHYPLKCVGCGVCASFCPTSSIRMVKRKTTRAKAAKKPGRGKPLPSKIKRRYRQ
jgi:Pyruvate/2-oxoacid:ferredoxin oxidoreductase delta subunit